MRGGVFPRRAVIGLTALPADINDIVGIGLDQGATCKVRLVGAYVDTALAYTRMAR